MQINTKFDIGDLVSVEYEWEETTFGVCPDCNNAGKVSAMFKAKEVRVACPTCGGNAPAVREKHTDVVERTVTGYYINIPTTFSSDEQIYYRLDRMLPHSTSNIFKESSLRLVMKKVVVPDEKMM